MPGCLGYVAQVFVLIYNIIHSSFVFLGYVKWKKSTCMKIKILGTFIIGIMLLAGCQGGSKDSENGNDQAGSEQQDPSAQQQMPGQMQQPQDIDVKDQEIQKFVDAAMEIQKLNQQMQQEVGKAVQDEGMKQERFNEIHRSQQSQQPGQANASDQEMQQYQNILDKLQQVQSGAQEDMRKVVEESGLSMQRYQQIATAAQQDTTLMKKIQQQMRSSMMNQMKQGQ